MKLHFLYKKILFASIYDPESIERIYQNKINTKVLLQLGGKVDLSYGGPIKEEVRIERFFDDPVAGRSALVSLDQIFVIVTENRFQYGSYPSYERAGVNRFEDFDIIAVKMGYLEPDLSQAAKGWVMALTPGEVSQNMANIPYEHLTRPIFPLDSYEFTPDLRAEIIEN